MTSIIVALLFAQVTPWGTPFVFNPHGQSIAAQDPSGNTAPFHVDASGNLLVSCSGGGGGGLTDAQLRAAPVPMSVASLPLPAGAAQDRTTAGAPLSCRLTDGTGFYVAGGSSGLTDAQLRAAAVPVSLATAPTTPVTGTFWQTTQPVSAAALPLPAGAAQDRTTAAAPLACRLTDGASFYTAGGGSGLTDAQLRATAVPISLATAPTTPVTGTVTATQATGTNLHVVVDAAPTTPVTGTFWQATQPISGTVAARAAKAAAAPLATVTSVTTSATQLPASPLANRVSLCVYNAGATTIYLGAASVTSAAGFPLPAGGAFCDDVGSQLYYGIAAAGTVEARILEN
jgi:hypothetical protein